MRCKRAEIDSLVLSGDNIEAIFIHSKNYSIERIKTNGILKSEEWLKAFGRKLPLNIIDARIVHTYRGLKLPLKVYPSTASKQTIEFAGLYGYNERSEQMRKTLEELGERLGYARVTRLDIAIDFYGQIPRSITRNLSRLREPFRYGNTTYWKSSKEKKTNGAFDIAIYDKSNQAGLKEKMMRIEFRFKSGYIKKICLNDVESIYHRMQKTIKKFTGLTVKIRSING